jgi:hypothetical protein
MEFELFWDVTLCQLLNKCRCFAESTCLHLLEPAAEKEWNAGHED